MAEPDSQANFSTLDFLYHSFNGLCCDERLPRVKFTSTGCANACLHGGDKERQWTTRQCESFLKWKAALSACRRVSVFDRDTIHNHDHNHVGGAFHFGMSLPLVCMSLSTCT